MGHDLRPQRAIVRYADVADRRSRALTRTVDARGHRRSIQVAMPHRSLVRTMTVAYVPDQRTMRHAVEPGVALRLSRARRSLAVARRALDGPSATRVPPASPANVLAHLWHWDGSERWSLAARGTTTG